MEHKQHESEGKLRGLPIAVASPVDLGRLIRELEALDNGLDQAQIRGQQVELPKFSALLTATIELNKLDLAHEDQRKLLMQFLVSIREKAPRLHVSLSADPSPEFSAKLASYLRSNIHPLVLITFGLQPNIGAGCVVRTTNKYFDFSLGASLTKNRDLVMQSLRQGISEQPTVKVSARPIAPLAPAPGVAT